MLYYSALAQTESSNAALSSVTTISNKTITDLSKQYSILENKLNTKSEKLLAGMQKKESKLQKKLRLKDSTKANELFTADVKNRYLELRGKLSDSADPVKKFPLNDYVPGLDSMQTALSFLSTNKYLSDDKLKNVQDLSNKLRGLQTQLQKATDIQVFIKEREENLKNQLLNLGLIKQLKGINEKAYYYQAQINEYKEILNDKQKLKDKILQTVRTLPAFKKFWQRNSYLSSLFPEPDNAGNAATQAVAGLQTRANVQNLIAQRMATSTTTLAMGEGTTSGSNTAGSQAFIQQQVNAAQGQLSLLKGKLDKLGINGGSSDMTMPDFKPNEQKTKSFRERLEYGFNVQTEPSHYFLPSTSDLAITLGYKLSDDKRVGLGFSYKIGWGSGLEHGFKSIHFSSEGIGLRSFIDLKSPIKSKGQLLNGLWISGGFEFNYFTGFKSLQELRNNIDVWQKSALLGVSKKYKVGKKEGSLQLLYDFLHNQQTPSVTAIKFRVGYNF